MPRISIAATVMLFALVGSVLAENIEVETVGRFLLSTPALSISTIIDHCSESVPEIKSDLLKEKAGFIDKLTEAERQVTEKFKDDPEFNAPIEEGVRQEVVNANLNALSIVKQRDPDTACRIVLENIQGATVDALRKVLEDTYHKHRDAAKVKGSE